MFDHIVESRAPARRRWLLIVVVALAAVSGVGALVVALSWSTSDDCETPPLTRLEPPPPQIALAAPPPPPPPPPGSPDGERAATQTEEIQESGRGDPDRERDMELPSICDEDSPRGQIHLADALYERGEYAEAVDHYAAAIDDAPELVIGHHNAGLAYLALFEEASDGDDGRAYAAAAAAHLETYLDSHRDDSRIESLLTRTWVDAELYDSAIGYWEDKLDDDPENSSIVRMLASINRQAGDYDRAIEWHQRRGEIATEIDGQIEALLDIGQLQLARLRSTDLVGAARLEVADRGIAALQAAEKLDPDSERIHSHLGSLYQLRTHGHGASWARAIDRAMSRQHLRRWKELFDGR